ncbi:hypothetical protein [Moorena bouillonii]|nr:hypothetical protein [Moorena bouillonii]
MREQINAKAIAQTQPTVFHLQNSAVFFEFFERIQLGMCSQIKWQGR